MNTVEPGDVIVVSVEHTVHISAALPKWFVSSNLQEDTALLTVLSSENQLSDRFFYGVKFKTAELGWVWTTNTIRFKNVAKSSKCG